MFPFIILISSFLFIGLSILFKRMTSTWDKTNAQQQQPSVGTSMHYLLLLIALNYFIILRHSTSSDAFLLGIILYGCVELSTPDNSHPLSFIVSLFRTFIGGLLFAVTTYFTNIMRLW